MADEGHNEEINKIPNVDNLLDSNNLFDFDRILNASLDSVDLELVRLRDQQATEAELDNIEAPIPMRTSKDKEIKQRLQQALEDCNSTSLDNSPDVLPLKSPTTAYVRATAHISPQTHFQPDPQSAATTAFSNHQGPSLAGRHIPCNLLLHTGTSTILSIDGTTDKQAREKKNKILFFLWGT